MPKTIAGFPLKYAVLLGGSIYPRSITAISLKEITLSVSVLKLEWGTEINVSPSSSISLKSPVGSKTNDLAPVST